MKVLISGMGIAGPSLAYWLHKYGHEVVLVEKAPEARKGGYIMDCWGIGYDMCEKMGILPSILKNGYYVNLMKWVNGKGEIEAMMKMEAIRELCNNRLVSVEHSDLVAAIISLVQGKVEMIFNDSIKDIDDKGDKVFVIFENNAPSQLFDLVIGADGQNSKVRELVFGPTENFLSDLKLRICAFEYDDYQPREEDVFVSHTEPKRQMSRFSKHDNKTLFMFAFHDDLLIAAGGGTIQANHAESIHVPKNNDSKRAALKSVFQGMAWETPSILADPKFEKLEDIYFDRVAQIKMKKWTKGRVALIGDAAASVSLLAGHGSSLAMLEAYILAGEISKSCPADGESNDYGTAFKNYEEILMPFLEKKQKDALKMANSIVPNHSIYIWMRNLFTRFFPEWLTAKIAFPEIQDDIKVPSYD
mmetsp:Transcript_19833/g.43037  ORF Transcript_19833/g.43037 Transcript_19833/m.43037 type:complete len:416 (-) Transcript_19833:207-1454(-)